jgi:hypothetical protein
LRNGCGTVGPCELGHLGGAEHRCSVSVPCAIVGGVKVELHWRYVEDDDDEIWGACPAIYAYAHRRTILYVGKADGSSTVRSRYNAADKDALFNFLAKVGINSHQVLVGEIAYEGRLSREMMTDVESLLIAGLKPREHCGNWFADRAPRSLCSLHRERLANPSSPFHRSVVTSAKLGLRYRGRGEGSGTSGGDRGRATSNHNLRSLRDLWILADPRQFQLS